LREIKTALLLSTARHQGFMATTKKTAKRKTTAKRGSGKRELINTGTDKRFVRRDGQGQFKESDDVGKSLTADRRRKARTKVKSGHGDRGDQ
jgi:hypothetical protein